MDGYCTADTGTFMDMLMVVEVVTIVILNKTLLERIETSKNKTVRVISVSREPYLIRSINKLGLIGPLWRLQFII